MYKKNLFLLLGIAAVLSIASATASQIFSANISSSVIVQTGPGLSILDSSTCASSVTSLAFGSIAQTQGSTGTITVCLKNTGNAPEFIIQTGTANSIVATSLPSGLSMSWSTSGSSLNPGSTVQATITLTNSGAAAGTYSFTTTFNAFDSATG